MMDVDPENGGFKLRSSCCHVDLPENTFGGLSVRSNNSAEPQNAVSVEHPGIASSRSMFFGGALSLIDLSDTDGQIRAHGATDRAQHAGFRAGLIGWEISLTVELFRNLEHLFGTYCDTQSTPFAPSCFNMITVRHAFYFSLFDRTQNRRLPPGRHQLPPNG
jgi:hypothetical protein